MTFRIFFPIIILIAFSISISAQSNNETLKIFGYFQNQFEDSGNPRTDERRNSFLLQQLNLFLQRDFQLKWSAFVNFELVNSFSSADRYGAFKLEEAWIKYRYDKRLQVRLGLQIPTFNHLNLLKNRTPLLPYVTRPLVYEESLEDIIVIEEYIPSIAFAQTYGVLPLGSAKFDYAVYLGNSPNLSTLDDRGRSGADTTRTFLVGSRFGVRYQDLKTGISLTHDKVNRFMELALQVGDTLPALEEMQRIRLGFDLEYRLGAFVFNGEYIGVFYDEPTELARFDKSFFYGTLGWQLTEPLMVYGSIWQTRTYENRQAAPGDVNPRPLSQFQTTVQSTSVGLVYQMNDRVRLKGQFVNLDQSNDSPRFTAGTDFQIYSAAISVTF